ncbi:MAG: hypothetical protein HKN48_11595 [Flavobacteriaceae bacterium]|nr:hypothetical protein [Flavobacteriaceae bacterium]
MTKFTSVIFIIFLLIACNNSTSEKGKVEITKKEKTSETEIPSQLSTAQTIAYKHGFEHWQEVEELKFTFNVDRSNRHFERSFIWKPKTNDVVYMNATDTVAYNRSQLDSISTLADKAFINDKYWLLAPFQLVWDEGTSFSEQENVVAPISKDTLNMLTIVYGSEGGYTPGDAYDFYYDAAFNIKEWVFRDGNGPNADMTNTWEDYKEFNGLKIATMHRDTTSDFKLYFTNISVK